jgi:FkbM family methyltransferase
MLHFLKLTKYRLARKLAFIRCIGSLGYLLHRLRLAARKGHTLKNALPFIWRPGTSDTEVIKDIIVSQQYAHPNSKQTVRTIIDAGANIGLTCLYFKEQFPDAQIIALEPDAENYALLCKNTAHLNGVTCLQEALWYRDEPVAIINQGAEPWAFRVNKSTETGTNAVPGTTITTLMKRFGMSRIDYLKIDIEGAEKELFSEQTEWLDSVNLVAIEFHDGIAVGCARNFYRATANDKWTEQRRGEIAFMLNNCD